MNTILITGTCKIVTNVTKHGTKQTVQYDVVIWGHRSKEELMYVSQGVFNCTDYSELWAIAKKEAMRYFKCPTIDDGAYTQFLDHIISLPS